MRTDGMKIAVLSGKGGAGKTLVSVNLAAAAGRALYIDCDVEEPNGHLFFKPADVREEEITVKLPAVDASLCTGCRRCVEFCKFHALAFIKERPYVFEEVCHSCGGCALLCPVHAISEREKRIGALHSGVSGGVRVRTGILDAGEASGIPIIKRLLDDSVSKGGLPVFIDCPPGSACIVMESIRGADYCVLVAEPTVFGAHNLAMVYELAKLFHKPCGAVLNKCMDGEQNPSEAFCNEQGIPVIGRIPFDNALGRLNAEAKIAAREKHEYAELFSGILQTVMREVRHEAAADTQR